MRQRRHARFGLALLGLSTAGAWAAFNGPLDPQQAIRDEGLSTADDEAITATRYPDYVPVLAEAVRTLEGGTRIGSRAPSSHPEPLVAAIEALWQLAHSQADNASAEDGRRAVNGGCAGGGTLFGTLVDADQDHRWSRGDSMRITAYGCRLHQAASLLNGSFTIRIQAATDDGGRAPVALAAQGRLEGFRIGSTTLSGSYRLRRQPGEDGAVRSILAYDHTDMELLDGRTVRCDTRLQVDSDAAGALQVTLGGTLQAGGHRLELLQPQPFAGGSALSGRLQLRDEAGNALTLEAKPDGLVDFAFFPRHSTRATMGRMNQWLAQASGAG